MPRDPFTVVVSGGRNLTVTRARVMDVANALRTIGAERVLTGACGLREDGTGDVIGGDAIGESAALELGIPFVRRIARWSKFKRSAGPIRNREMAKMADHVLILPGGAGTLDMEIAADERRIPKTFVGESWDLSKDSSHA